MSTTVVSALAAAPTRAPPTTAPTTLATPAVAPSAAAAPATAPITIGPMTMATTRMIAMMITHFRTDFHRGWTLAAAASASSLMTGGMSLLTACMNASRTASAFFCAPSRKFWVSLP